MDRVTLPLAGLVNDGIRSRLQDLYQRRYHQIFLKWLARHILHHLHHKIQVCLQSCVEDICFPARCHYHYSLQHFCPQLFLHHAV